MRLKSTIEKIEELMAEEKAKRDAEKAAFKQLTPNEQEAIKATIKAKSAIAKLKKNIEK